MAHVQYAEMGSGVRVRRMDGATSLWWTDYISILRASYGMKVGFKLTD